MKNKRLPSKIFKEKLEKFDREILINNICIDIVDKEIKGKHGIYVLYNKKGDIYYIGKASAIKQRLKDHRNNHEKSKKWTRFSVFLTKKLSYLDHLEDALISIVEPQGNGNKRRIIPSMNKRIKNAINKNIDEMSGEEKSSKRNKKKKKAKVIKRQKASKNHSGSPFKRRVTLRGQYRGGKEHRVFWLANGQVRYKDKNKKYNSLHALTLKIIKPSGRKTVNVKREVWRVKKGNSWVRLGKAG